MTKTETKARPGPATNPPAPPAQAAPPPKPRDGQPFQVGATTATVHTAKQAQGGTVTLRLRRIIKAPPERIYQAFVDPDALAKWLPPDGFVAKVHHLEPRVGGTFRMSFMTVTRSWSNAFGGKYLELVPHRRIVHTDAFESDDPAMQGTMKVTIELVPVEGGTEVTIVQEGIPAPAAAGAPTGWGQSLDNLARLVEPQLPF